MPELEQPEPAQVVCALLGRSAAGAGAAARFAAVIRLFSSCGSASPYRWVGSSPVFRVLRAVSVSGVRGGRILHNFL